MLLTVPLPEAARLLRAGRLVAFPTETVYGLGADAANDRAVAAIFDAKGRPHFNPLICHYPDAAEAAFAHVEAGDAGRVDPWRTAFWPGPLTLVLPRRVTCPVALLAGAGPGHAGGAGALGATRLRWRCCARSGGRSRRPRPTAPARMSPTTSAHVLDEPGRPHRRRAGQRSRARWGLKATVLDLTGAQPFLLRPGGVTARGDRGGGAGQSRRGDDPRAPPKRRARCARLACMVSHYAPALPVRLGAVSVPPPDEALLAFGPVPLDGT